MGRTTKTFLLSYLHHQRWQINPILSRTCHISGNHYRRNTTITNASPGAVGIDKINKIRTKRLKLPDQSNYLQKWSFKCIQLLINPRHQMSQERMTREQLLFVYSSHFILIYLIFSLIGMPHCFPYRGIIGTTSEIQIQTYSKREFIQKWWYKTQSYQILGFSKKISSHDQLNWLDGWLDKYNAKKQFKKSNTLYYLNNLNKVNPGVSARIITGLTIFYI